MLKQSWFSGPLPISSNYRMLAGADGAEENSGADPSLIRYRFLHDRTRQVAQHRLGEAEQAASHLRIGRLLQAQLTPSSSPELLFDVVGHLNAGAALLTEPAARRALAALNQRAARLARSATAYAAASSILLTAQSLLGTDTLEADPQLDFSVRRDLAEALYLVGDFAQAVQQLTTLIARDLGSFERAGILGLRMMLYTSQGRFEEGMQAGLSGLAPLGVSLPTTEEGCKGALFAVPGFSYARDCVRLISSLSAQVTLSGTRKPSAIFDSVCSSSAALGRSVACLAKQRWTSSASSSGIPGKRRRMSGGCSVRCARHMPARSAATNGGQPASTNRPPPVSRDR